MNPDAFGSFRSLPSRLPLALIGGALISLAAASTPAVAAKNEAPARKEVQVKRQAQPTVQVTPKKEAPEDVALEISRIYIEYNFTDNDLGFHVFLDGEDWRLLRIFNPDGKVIFDVTGRGPYAELGLTELFFEGAEPELTDVPLDELLAQFPEGVYEFEGVTVDGAEIEGESTLSHAVPAGPDVSLTDGVATCGNPFMIRWTRVTTTPPEPAGGGGPFPNLPIDVEAYQVIADPFQVTLPDTGEPNQAVTLPNEFVCSLEPGEHDFEVLAIDASGNQTITSDTFEVVQP
jgi:hypothetical protein